MGDNRGTQGPLVRTYTTTFQATFRVLATMSQALIIGMDILKLQRAVIDIDTGKLIFKAKLQLHVHLIKPHTYHNNNMVCKLKLTCNVTLKPLNQCLN